MKTLLILLVAGAAVAVTGATTFGKTESTGAKYIRERVRIVAQDTTTIEGKVITTYRQGKKTWMTTNDIQIVNRRVDRPVRYSKLKLIIAAKQAGKWETLKAAIKQMGLEDEWNACQFVTSDYPAYIAATNIVVREGIATEAEVQAFMKLAEDE